MKEHSGFTLIELVIVILIISILTATVLPRFANLEVKATEAVLKGALSSVKSAARIGNVYARTDAANGTGLVTIDDSGTTPFYMYNGYPAARGVDGTFQGILGLMEIDSDIQVRFTGPTGAVDTDARQNTAVLYIGNRCISYQAPQSAGTDPVYSQGVGVYDTTAGTCIAS